MDNPNEVPPLPMPPVSSSVYRDYSEKEESFATIDPNNPAWGLGGAILIWVSSFFVQLLPLVILVPYAVYRGLSGTSPELLFLHILSIFPTQVLTFAMLWAFVTGVGQRPFLASLGWAWSPRLRLWPSIALGVALFVVAMGLAKLLGAEKPTGLEQLINSSLAARYVIAFLAVFTAPFTEEFVYRGVLYPALQRTIGVKGAVVLVAGLFAGIHVPQYWPNVGVISAVALLSIVLTVVRAYTGRILPCVVIHLAFNAVQAVLLILEPYAQNFLPRPEPTVPALSILGSLSRLTF